MKKKQALKDFGMREQAILKEINRLALDVRTGQSSLDLEGDRRGR